MTQTKKRYAENTTVSVEKSQVEVQKILKRYGATETGYGERDGKGSLMFRMHNRYYRIELTYPGLDQFRYDARKARRTGLQMEQAREKEICRLWRAVLMVVKAKLEAVESGILTFEEEFFAHMVMHDGSTMSQSMEQAITKGHVSLLASPEASYQIEEAEF